MSGVSKIALAESALSLKSLMKKQKKALSYAKVQALYLLKIQAVETIRYLAVVMGRLRINDILLATVRSRGRIRKTFRRTT